MSPEMKRRVTEPVFSDISKERGALLKCFAAYEECVWRSSWASKVLKMKRLNALVQPHTVSSQKN